MSGGLSVFFCVHRVMLKYMKRNVTIRQVRVFLHVAIHGPVTLKQIAKMIPAKEGTVYDDLQDLGKVAVTGRQGACLVEELRPAIEGQAIQYRLSGRGRLAAEAMVFQMDGRFAADHEEDEPLQDYFASRELVTG